MAVSPAALPLGNFPAVIHIHGHGQSPSEACEMIERYTLRGYILFTPLLRGVHDDQYAFTNTGLYIDDYLDSIGGTVNDTIDYLHQEIAEVRAALTYLTMFSIGGIKQVDPARIALTGHSFGGSLVTFAAAANLSPRPAATVDLSGGVLSWGGSTAWKTAYQAEAALHQMPIRFQQVINESSALVKTDPTIVPITAANGSGTGEAEAAIYSDVLGATDIQAAHTAFLLDKNRLRAGSRRSSPSSNATACSCDTTRRGFTSARVPRRKAPCARFSSAPHGLLPIQ